MKQRGAIERVPAIVAFVLVAAVVALLFEIAVASARNEPADPIVVGGLFTLIGSTITALVALWLKESSPRKDPPEAPPHDRRRHEDWDEPPDRPGYLELTGSGRWTQCWRA